ncbi:MAG: CPBP family glutamic-type intramembrane protease [Cyclobacteriaceae bacterium]
MSTDVTSCSKCGNQIAFSANFCGTCGNSLLAIKPAGIPRRLKISLSYFFTILLINLLIGYTVDFYTFETDVIASSFLIIITLVYAYGLGYLRSVTFKTHPSLVAVSVTIISAVLMACMVSYAANWINLVLWEMEYLEIDIYLQTTYPFLFAMIFTALIPAVFEELAFRGFMFGEIAKNAGAGTALIVTSLLFAIMHLSAIGLIWYIPGGFLLGFLRLKYKSITYCILAHFFYNLMIIGLDFNKYFTEW